MERETPADPVRRVAFTPDGFLLSDEIAEREHLGAIGVLLATCDTERLTITDSDGGTRTFSNVSADELVAILAAYVGVNQAAAR